MDGIRNMGQKQGKMAKCAMMGGLPLPGLLDVVMVAVVASRRAAYCERRRYDAGLAWLRLLASPGAGKASRSRRQALRRGTARRYVEG